MAYESNLKDWGDSGSEYPDGYHAEEDEPIVDDWENFFRYHTIEDLQHLLNRDQEHVSNGEHDQLTGDVVDRASAITYLSGNIFSQDTEPTAPVEGDLWVDTSVTDAPEIYYYNSNGIWKNVADSEGALYGESQQTELVNQWWRLFDGNEGLYETAMEDEEKSDAITSSKHAMRVVFWLDL